MNVRNALVIALVGAVSLFAMTSDVLAAPQNTGLTGSTVVRAGTGVGAYYLLLEDVPGLTVTWSSPTGTVLPAPYTMFRDFGKEQYHRGAITWATPGLETVTATVSWTGGSYVLTMSVLVI